MQGFKRKISGNKYRFKMTTQPKNNNLDYMIAAIFRNIIDYLYIRSKVVKMILQEILLIRSTCH